MPITVGSGITIGPGITISSDIVSSGLVVQLTGASYPGSGTTWTDLINSDNNATLVNSPVYSSANGGYFTFASASSQYATLAGSPLTTTSYTKSCWFYLNSVVDNNLISYSDPGGHYMFFGATSTLYCGHTAWTGFPTTFASTTTFATSRWYNVSLTFNTTDGMFLYVNGALDNSYTAQKTAPTASQCNLACYAAGGNLLNGRIGEVLIYNRSLTATEVSQNFNTSKNLYGF